MIRETGISRQTHVRTRIFAPPREQNGDVLGFVSVKWFCHAQGVIGADAQLSESGEKWAQTFSDIGRSVRNESTLIGSLCTES